MEIILNSYSISDLPEAATILLNTFKNSTVFAFYGQMGAGKTTFIKEICKQLQVSDTVCSPTFSLINQYNTEKGELIYHFDFYRIKKLQEVYDIGYEDYFYGNNGICLVEWPELIEELLPPKHVKVKISVDETTECRIITASSVL